MIISRTPYRITLGGGGTDLPSFYEKHGGYCITMAIDNYMYVSLKPDELDNMCKMRYSEIENVSSPQCIKNSRAREVLCKHDIRSVEINTSGDLPSNAGMGSSGTFLVGLLKVIREYKRIDTSPRTIAEEACEIEITKLQEPVGKQDQYIASYGGIRILDINKDGFVNVQTLDISKNDFSDFLSNIHVYSIGIQRNASDILKDQSKLIGNTEYLLKTIKDYGYKTKEILESKNYDEYGILLDNYWSIKKLLSNKITVSPVDKIYEDIKQNFSVLGGKIIGAGGGGFFLVYCNKDVSKLNTYMSQQGMKKLRFNVDYSGSKILGNYL
jgi:D-glycero-alpha-D-manno-heptose-7-phosphate kinase